MSCFSRSSSPATLLHPECWLDADQPHESDSNEQYEPKGRASARKADYNILLGWSTQLQKNLPRFSLEHKIQFKWIDLMQVKGRFHLVSDFKSLREKLSVRKIFKMKMIQSQNYHVSLYCVQNDFFYKLNKTQPWDFRVENNLLKNVNLFFLTNWYFFFP